MARLTLISAGTPYITIVNSAGAWYNGSTFETYAAGNWSTYDVAATQYGSSKVWYVTFPSISAGTYDIVQFLQAGGSPAQTDSPEGATTQYWDATNLLEAAQVKGMDASILTASALATDAASEIADAILSRNVSNVEGSAAEHTLCTLILQALESAISGTTMTINRTDGTTPHATKTLTLTGGATPIRGIT